MKTRETEKPKLWGFRNEGQRGGGRECGEDCGQDDNLWTEL